MGLETLVLEIPTTGLGYKICTGLPSTRTVSNL